MDKTYLKPEREERMSGDTARKKVLITGAAGAIGRVLREDRSRSYEGNSGSGEQEMAHERKTP